MMPTFTGILVKDDMTAFYNDRTLTSDCSWISLPSAAVQCRSPTSGAGNSRLAFNAAIRTPNR